MDEFLHYNDLLSLKDFEYFFRFKKMNTNFEELWRMKSTARESLKEWLLAIHADPQLSEVIANASSELIENCIRYSCKETFSFVFIHVIDKIITIQTVNKAVNEQKKVLREFIEYIENSNKTPAELYIEKIAESIKTGKSQVGLLKIMMETGSQVKLVDEIEDIVHLTVKMHI